LVTFAYRSGWRISEIRNLRWNQVNRSQGIVTLPPGSTRNREPRTIYLDEEVKEVIERQWKRRKKSGCLTPYMFANRDGTDCIKESGDHGGGPAGRRTWGRSSFMTSGVLLAATW
jgi:integrase